MIIKKLQRYVERDKFRKVSKLLSNHGELVNAILSRKSGKTGLHLACKMGCYDTARVLIKRGADVSIKDSKKSLALHYAACFCLSKKRHSRNLVSDLVSPLIAGSLASLDEANSAGITCRSLLDALNSRQERSDREKVEAAGLAVQDDDESEGGILCGHTCQEGIYMATMMGVVDPCSVKWEDGCYGVDPPEGFSAKSTLYDLCPNECPGLLTESN